MCKHKFQKFDDTSLFCERCGERKVIAGERAPQVVYVPTVPYSPVYPVDPWRWYPPRYEVWCGSGISTVQADSTFILNGGITYDSQS